MIVKTERTRIRDEAGGYSLDLIFPVTELEKVNIFYKKLIDSLRFSAKEHGLRIISDCKVLSMNEDNYSLYIDIYAYREGKLLSCKRISDSRDKDGYIVPPPRKIKGKIPRNGGWYFDGKGIFIYENSFTPGDELGVRRSEYNRFFYETRVLTEKLK